MLIIRLFQRGANDLDAADDNIALIDNSWSNMQQTTAVLQLEAGNGKV